MIRITKFVAATLAALVVSVPPVVDVHPHRECHWVK